MKTSNLNRFNKREKGMVTIDYLFAFVLVSGFIVLLFSLSMTLTVVEITQYITFSAARNYYGSHITEAAQRELAFRKWTELVQNPAFGNLYNNGWFEIDQNTPSIGDATALFPQYRDGLRNKNIFVGAGTNFNATILDLKIPFFGSTEYNGNGGGQGFNTFIASYLSREVTFGECWNYNNRRWEAIQKLDTGGAAPYNTTNVQGAYLPIHDNGC